jgi:hypothetical protein
LKWGQVQYELTTEYGEVYGTALPRDSYLLKTIDNPDNWLKISDIIGSEKARLLANNNAVPTRFLTME